MENLLQEVFQGTRDGELAPGGLPRHALEMWCPKYNIHSMHNLMLVLLSGLNLAFILHLHYYIFMSPKHRRLIHTRRYIHADMYDMDPPNTPQLPTQPCLLHQLLLNMGGRHFDLTILGKWVKDKTSAIWPFREWSLCEYIVPTYWAFMYPQYTLLPLPLEVDNCCQVGNMA